MKKIILKYKLVLLALFFLVVLFFVAYYFIVLSNFENITYRDQKSTQNINSDYGNELPSTTDLNKLDLNNNIVEINIETQRESPKLLDELVFQKGDTIIKIMEKRGYKVAVAILIAKAIEPIISVNLIQIGDRLEIYSSDKKEIVYLILITKNLRVKVRNENNLFVAEYISQPKSYEYIYKEFSITTNLYGNAIQNNIPNNILQRTIKLYEKKIDFEKDIKKGNFVQFYYRNNKNLKNDEVKKYELLYSSITNNDFKNEFYSYETKNGNISFYDLLAIYAD